MPRINLTKVVDYWVKTAQNDKKVMESLFKAKHYSNCLFFGHIILEKILKAHVVFETKKHAPYIHDLLRLDQLANCDLSKIERKFLNKVNDFNISSRYPDYKLDFYKKYNKLSSIKVKYLKINKLYEKLCQKLKEKRKQKS
ncbi:MAG: HEPN domain-containing protein [Candidatus Moranbacteria bacterium]|nr:HEPN domain-containing protein [Candidatus Moranbacteria bacterium]